jgi:hypothetical protein
VIPPDPAENDISLAQIGCSAPVNNAPPASVMACSALLVQGSIDATLERFELPDEIVDVYRPLVDSPPFDRVGHLRL